MSGTDKPFDKKTLTERLDVNFALQAAGLGIWELDLTTNQVLWDERCRALVGLDRGDTDITAFEETIQYIHPDDLNRVMTAIHRAMKSESGGLFDESYRTLGADGGRLRWVRFWGQGYFTEAGELYRFSGVAQEITQQMLDKQQLVDQQVLLDSIIQQTPAPTLVLRGDEYHVERINQPMLAFMGRGEEVIGHPFLMIMPEVENQLVWQQVQRVYQEGVDFDQTEVLVSHLRDGVLKNIYYDVSYRPLREGGQVTGMIQVAIDVTEQVLARKRIEESETKVRSLLGQAPVATCLFVGRELIVELANEPMLSIWGKGADVLDKPLAQVLPELVGQPFLKILDEVYATGQPYQASADRCDLMIEEQLRTFYFNFTYQPIFDEQGQVYAILDMAVDVTEQVIAQQQLKASEAQYRRLSEELERQVQLRTEELAATNEELAAINEELTASNEELTASNEETEATNENLTESNYYLTRSNDNLEKFAYVASHDLQEPLRKIQSFGDLLKERYGGQLGDGADYLERMQLAASRMSTLIRDLLTYSRISTQRDRSKPVPLADVINQALMSLDLRLQETGAVVRVDPLPTVTGDPSQLAQLFQNLIGNALKFRRLGVPSVIHIRTKLVFNKELPLSVKPAKAVMSYHQIEVIDNGVGFDEKYLDRIFEVFQRLHSKRDFEGTGIGLAICEKVAANHGGAITASSQPGQGATFRVYLPA